MIPLVICALIASASALNLAPATVTGATVRNFEYYMSNQETVNGLLQKISGIQGALSFADQNYMNQIAGEIFLYAEVMDHNPYHSLKWQLKINKALGVLRVIDISAKARAATNGRTLLIVGKALKSTKPFLKSLILNNNVTRANASMVLPVPVRNTAILSKFPEDSMVLKSTKLTKP